MHFTRKRFNHIIIIKLDDSKNIFVLIGYTLVYHGLYYCPFMEKRFTRMINFFHNL